MRLIDGNGNRVMRSSQPKMQDARCKAQGSSRDPNVISIVPTPVPAPAPWLPDIDMYIRPPLSNKWRREDMMKE
jgi:hypothetical protein